MIRNKTNQTIKKIEVFLFVLFLLNITNPGISSTLVYQEGGKKIIEVYDGTDEKYLLLLFQSDVSFEEMKYLPLAFSQKWYENKEWINKSKEYEKILGLSSDEKGYRSDNETKKNSSFQGQIFLDLKKIDGRWGNNSWEALAIFLREQLYDEDTIMMDDIQFIKKKKSDIFQEMPNYEDINLFSALNNHVERYIIKLKLDEVKIPNKAEILSTEENLDLAEMIQNLKEIGFEFRFNIPVDSKKYLENVNLDEDNKSIVIQRVPNIHPKTAVQLDFITYHKKFNDITKSIGILIAFPDKTFLESFQKVLPYLYILFAFMIGVFIGRFSHKIYGKLSRKASSIKNLSDLYDSLTGKFEEETEKVKHKIDKKNQEEEAIEANIRLAYMNIEKSIQKMNFSETKDPNLEKILNLKTIADLSRIESGKILLYINESKDKLINLDKHFIEAKEFLKLGVNIPDKEKLYSLSAIHHKEFIDEYREKLIDRVRNHENKLRQLIKIIHEVFNPFIDIDDNFRQLFDSKYWISMEYHIVSPELISKLREKTEILEIQFPESLRDLEKQLMRIKWLLNKVLMKRVHSLDHIDLKSDLSSLSQILLKPFFIDSRGRPEWTKKKSLKISPDATQNIQEEFWDKIWNDEGLGDSMQIIQRIIFKLHLILKNKDSLEEQIYNDVFEIEMVSKALLHLLQSIAISCGRIYHDISPGNKLNLNFAKKEGGHHILKEDIFKKLADTYNWEKGDIYDVGYWGVSEITPAALKNTIKSRVVTVK